MNVLPDVLTPGLKIVFCGTAASTESARVGAYYAKHGNKFWRTLHEVGLTPRQLEPHEFPSLAEYGIGLTDIAKSASGMDVELRKEDFDPESLRAKIERYVPRVLAFTGKKSAKVFYQVKTIDYGQQSQLIGTTVVFVLPSTSGAANAFWKIEQWQQMADWLSEV